MLDIKFTDGSVMRVDGHISAVRDNVYVVNAKTGAYYFSIRNVVYIVRLNEETK